MKASKILIVAATMLLLFVSFMLRPMPRAEAAPGAAPTPISLANNAGNSSRISQWFLNKTIVTDTRSTCFENGDKNLTDLQWAVDQSASLPNTLTLKLQATNDMSHFVDLVTLVNASAADVTNMQQYAIFGRFQCLYADVVNTRVVTITGIGANK